MLLLTGYYYQGYLPLWEQRQETLKLKEVREARLYELEQVGEDLPAFLREAEGLIRESTRLQEQVPGPVGLDESLVFFSTAADWAGVDLLTLHFYNDTLPLNPDQTEEPQKTIYHISAAGGYFALMDFLLVLENAPRIYALETCLLSLEQRAEEAGEFPTGAEEEGNVGTANAAPTQAFGIEPSPQIRAEPMVVMPGPNPETKLEMKLRVYAFHQGQDAAGSGMKKS